MAKLQKFVEFEGRKWELVQTLPEDGYLQLKYKEVGWIKK